MTGPRIVHDLRSWEQQGGLRAVEHAIPDRRGEGTATLAGCGICALLVPDPALTDSGSAAILATRWLLGKISESTPCAPRMAQLTAEWNVSGFLHIWLSLWWRSHKLR